MFIIIAIVAVILFAIFFLMTYKVVGTNEAHVIVFMGRGRKIKSPVAKDGVDGKTSYFYIPFLMKRYIMPLTNVKLDIDDIFLKDIQVAPFECDVVTWLHIEDPVKAAERLDFSQDVFASLHKDLQAIVQAIARAAAMKQEILDILRDRTTFAQGVSSEVNGVLESWGVQLVNLEVNDIRDAPDSHVIENYENIRKATVESLTRVEVSKRDREAVEAEQENRRLAETATADSEKAFKTKQIQRDEALGVAEQEKLQRIAVAEQSTNEQKVSALRVTTVGEANIVKEAAVVTASGEGEAIRIKGEKEANVVTLKGQAEGNAIEAKGLAEAKAKDAMAEALKKYNDAATTIEKIKATIAVQTAFAEAYGKIAEHAEIKIVSSGEGADLFGIPLNAKTGADFGQLIEAMGPDKVAGVATATSKGIDEVKKKMGLN